MDIGGCDVRIDNPPRRDYFRAILEIWPDAVMERDELDPNHMFVYKNADARDAWEKHGTVQSTMGQAIFIISEPDAVVLVVDDENDPETKRILDLFK